MPLPVVTPPSDDSYYRLKDGATVLVTLEGSFREVDPLPRRNLTPVRTAGGSDLFYRGDGRPLAGLKVLEGLVFAADEWTLGTRLAAIRTALATADTLERVTPGGNTTWALESEPVPGFLTDAPASSPGKAFQRRVTLYLLATSLATEPAASIPTVTLPDPVTGTPGSVTYPDPSGESPPTVTVPVHVTPGGETTYTGTPALIEYSWGQKADALTTWDYDLGLALADLLDNGTSALLPVVAGDLALLYVYARDNAAAVPPIITTPTGWSLVAHAQNVGGTMTGAVYSRVLTAGDMADASFNVSLTADRSVRWRAVMDFWRTTGGVVTAGTPVMDGTASTTAGALEVAGLNNTGPGTACIAAFGYYTTTTYPDWSDPSGWNSFTGAAGGTAPASRVAVSKRALASGFPFPSASLVTLAGKDASEFIAVPFLIRGN
jgi:hypothetical protein